MMAKHLALAAALLSVVAPAAASAQSSLYRLTYTTFNDGINPPVTLSATLSATRDPFAATGFVVTSITGTRGSQAITGISDPFSEFYFPATTLPGYGFSTYLDSFGITFSVGGVDYQIYRDPGDTTFYHESQNPNGISVGRLILPSSFSITQAVVTAAAPEPATWATMIFGFAIAGQALRRRRKVAVRVSYAG